LILGKVQGAREEPKVQFQDDILGSTESRRIEEHAPGLFYPRFKSGSRVFGTGITPPKRDFGGWEEPKKANLRDFKQP